MTFRLFSGSRLRTVGEVFLAVAILGALVYDLAMPSGRSGPTAIAEDAMGLEWKAQLGGDTPLTQAEQATPITTRLTSHFQGQANPAISPGNTTTICSNTTFSANPVQVGTALIPQAMIVSLGGAPGCSQSPYFLYPSAASGLASVNVNPGSWITFTALGAASTAVMDTLTLQPGSTFEVDASGYSGTAANVLRTVGPCPSIAGVNAIISNCPGACNLAMTSLAPSGCQIGYTVTGNTPVASTAVGSITMNKACATYSQLQFLSDVSAATGIPTSNIKILSWLCGSITTTFQVLGANVATANAGVAQIINSANNGVLKNTLGVTSASIIGGTTTTTTYYPPTYPAPTTTAFPMEFSSSNPALFALLTLLAIPLLAALGVGIWCCMKQAPAAAAPAQVYYAPAEPTYYIQPEPQYYVQPEQTYYTYEATPIQTPAYGVEEQVIVPVPVADGAMPAYGAGTYGATYTAPMTYTAGAAPMTYTAGAAPMTYSSGAPMMAGTTYPTATAYPTMYSGMSTPGLGV